MRRATTAVPSPVCCLRCYPLTLRSPLTNQKRNRGYKDCCLETYLATERWLKRSGAVISEDARLRRYLGLTKPNANAKVLT